MEWCMAIFSAVSEIKKRIVWATVTPKETEQICRRLTVESVELIYWHQSVQEHSPAHGFLQHSMNIWYGIRNLKIILTLGLWLYVHILYNTIKRKRNKQNMKMNYIFQVKLYTSTLGRTWILCEDFDSVNQESSVNVKTSGCNSDEQTILTSSYSHIHQRNDKIQ